MQVQTSTEAPIVEGQGTRLRCLFFDERERWQTVPETVMAVTAKLVDLWNKSVWFLLVNWGGDTIVPSGSRPILPSHETFVTAASKGT